jgi:hypothetical protein
MSRWCEGRQRGRYYPLEALAEELANQRLEEVVRAAVEVAHEEFHRQLAEAIAEKEAEIEREGRGDDELRDPTLEAYIEEFYGTEEEQDGSE